MYLRTCKPTRATQELMRNASIHLGMGKQMFCVRKNMLPPGFVLHDFVWDVVNKVDLVLSVP